MGEGLRKGGTTLQSGFLNAKETAILTLLLTVALG